MVSYCSGPALPSRYGTLANKRKTFAQDARNWIHASFVSLFSFSCYISGASFFLSFRCCCLFLIPVQAKLTDGREFAASIVGSDPSTDIAVLRLNAGGGFPVVPIGDSSKLRVGQVGLPYLSLALESNSSDMAISWLRPDWWCRW